MRRAITRSKFRSEFRAAYEPTIRSMNSRHVSTFLSCRYANRAEQKLIRGARDAATRSDNLNFSSSAVSLSVLLKRAFIKREERERERERGSGRV